MHVTGHLLVTARHAWLPGLTGWLQADHGEANVRPGDVYAQSVEGNVVISFFLGI